MSYTKIMTGRDLGQAICAHFGLNINQVQSDYRIKTEPDGLASINLTISLTPDDLAGIARCAGGDAEAAYGRAAVHAIAQGGVWSDVVAVEAVIKMSGGAPLAGDRVTIYDTSKAWAETREWDGHEWALEGVSMVLWAG